MKILLEADDAISVNSLTDKHIIVILVDKYSPYIVAKENNGYVVLALFQTPGSAQERNIGIVFDSIKALISYYSSHEKWEFQAFSKWQTAFEWMLAHSHLNGT